MFFHDYEGASHASNDSGVFTLVVSRNYIQHTLSSQMQMAHKDGQQQAEV